MTFRRSAIGLTSAFFALSLSLALAQQSQTGTAAGNQSDTSTSKTTTKTSGARPAAIDKKFMISAAQGGMAEVELGRLAVQHGGSDAVKQFGQHMIDDHTKANTTLMQIASQKQVTLPKTLNAKDKALKTHLSKLSGTTFDQEYISDMVKDHQQDIAEFQHEADQGRDPDVKSFASSTLPTLKMHLSMAQSVKDGKGMPADSSSDSGTAPSEAGTTNSGGTKQ